MPPDLLEERALLRPAVVSSTAFASAFQVSLGNFASIGTMRPE